MGIIATERDAANLANSGVQYVGNRCCTKSRAETLGCYVNGSYSSNQLVELSNLIGREPLSIYFHTNGTISFSRSGLSYSYNKTNWYSNFSSGVGSTVVYAGETIYFKGDMTPINRWPNFGIGKFKISGNVSIGGNVYSLVNYNTDLSSYPYCFCRLFHKCSTILNCSSDLFKNINVLGPHCFEEMFLGCSNLSSAPNIPNITMKDYCCRRMFLGCSALSSVVSMPSTLLAPGCYQEMYRACTNISSVAQNALPATTLYHHCYMEMFMDCTRLTSAPRLPATSLAWGCYGGMFERCTSLTTAPDLNAQTFVQDCYDRMFYGCSSLTYVKCLGRYIDTYPYDTQWAGLHSILNSWMDYTPWHGTFVIYANNIGFDPRIIYDEDDPDDSYMMDGWTVNVI